MMVYNAHFLLGHQFFKIKADKTLQLLPGRTNWTRRNRHWHFIIFGLGLLLAFYCFLKMHEVLLIISLVLGVLSFAYTIPLLPPELLGVRSLRDWGLSKIFTLTAVWTIVTCILPMLFWNKNPLSYPYEIAMRFVFMFALCVAFDVRDMETDLKRKIQTLPNLIGFQKSMWLMKGTLVLFLVLSVIQYWRYPSVGRLVAEILTTILCFVVLKKVTPQRNEQYFLGWVDGMMLVYGLLIIAFK